MNKRLKKILIGLFWIVVWALLAMAIAKKALGNKYNAPRVIDEWVDKKWEKSNK